MMVGNELGGTANVRDLFVGRTQALDAFYRCRESRGAQSGVYYYGRGGLGKTWILAKLIADGRDDPHCVTTEIIDFANTQNHSVCGLRAAIVSRLRVPEAFRGYDEALADLDAWRARGTAIYPGAIAGREERVQQRFLEGCRQAIEGRTVPLLFDSLDRVQQQYVGRWLLREFLPQVPGLLVAIAGRPGPMSADMPDYLLPFRVQGWDLEEAGTHIRRRLPNASEQAVQTIWEYTQGIPLMVDLILDLPAPHPLNQFLAKLDGLPKDLGIQVPDLQRALVGQFVQPGRRNCLLWAMALLHRRFDLPVLRYLLSQQWSGLKPGDYDAILAELGQARYIRECPELQDYLLQDELRRMVSEYLLDDVLDHAQQRTLLDLMMTQYYPQAIERADADLSSQLRAEQMGYLLDRDPKLGLAQYETYRSDIESAHDYDLEELMWAEVYPHLGRCEDQGYQPCVRRGEWLRRRSLFRKAEEHYARMLDRFPQHRVEISQAMGVVALRQGNFQRARSIFEGSLAHVAPTDYTTIAMIEDNIGQMEERAGQWDDAFAHYARCFRAAIDAGDEERMVSVHINRGHLYSLQGLYEEAKLECNAAIDMLEPLPESFENTRRAVYAWINLGTAQRHTQNFEAAASAYHQSLTLAEQNADQETICHVMQHVGINLHLWGRRFRREKHRMATACQYQREAWRYLTRALDMARKTDWRDVIAHGLNRLAKVYRETDRLQTMGAEYAALPDVAEALAGLQREIRNYDLPFESCYEDQFLFPGSFGQLDWLRKAARLFELSALTAMDANHHRRALDSLTEFAILLLELERYDLVPQVIAKIKHMKGYEYQEGLFGAMCDIIQGDLYCEQGQYDEALEAYRQGYTHLARQTGYASYILNDRLWNLSWRFREQLPREVIPHWCDVLEAEWLSQKVLTARPDMLRMLETFRLDALR